MDSTLSRRPLKIGLLIVAVAWFLLVFHELVKASYAINEYQYMLGPARNWVLVTDIFGLVAIIFRAVAAAVAIVGILLYFFTKTDKSALNVQKLVGWVLIGEAVYWAASFLPSGIWGFTPNSLGSAVNSINLFFVLNTGLPCLIEGILIPALLIKLFLQLSPNRASKDAVKWGLIAGSAYVFVFWLNNTCNWLNVVLRPTEYYTGMNGAMYPYAGFEYMLSYPDHILSFGLTVIGLLVVTLYAAYFARKSIGTKGWRNLALGKVGAIITAVGLYFLVIYVMWLAVGTNSQLVLVNGAQRFVDVKWSDWYAWFLGHNLDLWVLSLPAVGVPLLFERNPAKQKPI